MLYQLSYSRSATILMMPAGARQRAGSRRSGLGYFFGFLLLRRMTLRL